MKNAYSQESDQGRSPGGGGQEIMGVAGGGDRDRQRVHLLELFFFSI